MRAQCVKTREFGLIPQRNPSSPERGGDVSVATRCGTEYWDRRMLCKWNQFASRWASPVRGQDNRPPSHPLSPLEFGRVPPPRSPHLTPRLLLGNRVYPIRWPTTTTTTTTATMTVGKKEPSRRSKWSCRRGKGKQRRHDGVI